MTIFVEQAGRQVTTHAPVADRSDPLNFRTESVDQEETFWTAMRSAQPYNPEKIIPFELTDEEWDVFWRAVHDE